MKLTSIFGIIAVACLGLVTANPGNNAKCLSKPEATAFVKDFGKVLFRAYSSNSNVCLY